jgi:hypothetical protein
MNCARLIQSVSACLAVMIFSCAARAAIDVSNLANVLAGPGRTIVVSSAFGGDETSGFGMKSGLIDNLAASSTEDGPFLFNQADSPNKLSISGFTTPSPVGTFRIFTAADNTREPTQIIVKSSASLVSTLNAADYGTSLGTFNFSQPPTGVIPMTSYDTSTRGYFDLVLSSPMAAGTQSIYLEMTAPTSGIRIYELQALQLPEPTSLSLVGGAVMFAFRRTRRAA